MTTPRTRPFVALVAAYALALQTVIAGLSLGAHSGEAALLASGGLCLTGHSQDAPAPADRMPCCSVAACCQAGADAAATPCDAPALPVLQGQVTRHDVPVAHIVRVIAQGPQQPRAPPGI